MRTGPAEVKAMGKLLRLERTVTVSPQPRPAGTSRAPVLVPPSEVISRLNALERCALFFDEDASILRILARRARRLTVPAGTAVVGQGERGDCLYVIERGHCLVRVEPAPGHVIMVAQLGPGELFGEDAFVSGEASGVSVVARDELHLIAIDRPTLYSVPPGGTPLLHELTRFAEQRRQMFADMAAQARWDQLTGSATVLAVYSPKGGTGRTTLALNLAVRLAARHPRQVLFLDLAFPFPHAALMANLAPGTCLARLHDTPAESFEEALLSAGLYHAGGVTILPGALRAEEADLVGADLVARAIEILRRSFRYILVDLPVAISDVTLAAFDQSQRVLMVVTPEITAVRGAAESGQILEMLGMPPDRVLLVMNHRAQGAGLSRDAVERGAGRQVALEIAYDGARPETAATHGRIVALESTRSEIARSAEALAALLESLHSPAALEPPDAAVAEEVPARP